MSSDELVEKLAREHALTEAEYGRLIGERTPATVERAASLADAVRREYFGNRVFIRGLIEIGNYCRNDCLYCGIRRSNRAAERYRLTDEEILACCDEGYRLGFRTFVLQGGEDAANTDARLCALISAVKGAHPDCAVTLSLGERSRESYERLFLAGADRYLLRHETASPAHYARLHPPEMDFGNRMRCLSDLREIGYQVGCGFMVGSPWQTERELAADLKFVETFRPEMCGIGPFVPHRETPLKDFPHGSVELTCFLLSLLRLIHPPMLIPATTALGTVDGKGREKGILAGANVVMPNLSPVSVRKKYELYDGKICTGEESAQCLGCLDARLRSVGFETVVDRGDFRKNKTIYREN